MTSIDSQLEGLMRTAEPAIGDNGFSDQVMAALPRRRFTGARARRWTLGGAAAAGGLATALLGAPLEGAFRALTGAGDGATLVIVTVFATILAAPVVWALYSE